jgi:hypothetical protein
MCTSYIYNHIRSLPATQIFTTREVLIYGKRAAVDSALSRMVSGGFITRLAQGVFVRDASEEPTMADVVRAKLQAYQSCVGIHAANILHELSIFMFGNEMTFAKFGSSSSFNTYKGRAYVKNVCGRKMSLCQILAGRMAYALWYLGKGSPRILGQAIALSTENLNKRDRELFWMAGALMPAWLNDSLQKRYPSTRIVINNPFQMKLAWTRYGQQESFNTVGNIHRKHA